MVAETIETFCRVSKDGFAARGGDLVVLRRWQHRLLGEMFARRPDGRLRHRVSLVGMPRKNGKSALGSGLALDGLLFGGRGSDVFSCAGDKLQAGIVFGETKNMVNAEPELAGECKPMRDCIEVPSTGSVYRVCSAEAYTKEGLNPKRVLFDEVHVQPNDELWNVMALAMAARLDPMMIGITTAGVTTQSDGRDTLCYRMWKYGRDIARGDVDDASFYMAWWGAPDEADHRDPAVWAAANPGFGDLIDPEDFESKVKTTPEAEFRTKRLNIWVSTETAWLPHGAWDDCEWADRPVELMDEVILGVDGSWNNDSTALLAARVGKVPHVEVVHVWERPDGAAQDWRVPIEEVEDAVRGACRRYRVLEVVFDPFRWGRSMQVLEAEGLPIVEFPQSDQRMIPATQRFYEAVLNQTLTHDGNPVLARHIRNCTTKLTHRGSRVQKETKGSGRKIDAAVAAVMAVDRAAQVVEAREPRIIDLAELLAEDDG